MDVEVSEYEKKAGIHYFWLTIPKLSVKGYTAFYDRELKQAVKIEQIINLFKVRVEDAVWDMLYIAKEKNESFTFDETKPAREFVDIDDILVKMLIVCLYIKK